MSDIDHEQAAITSLYYANEYKDGDDPASVHRQALAEAQVHASLAIAAELRTANLQREAVCLRKRAIDIDNLDLAAGINQLAINIEQDVKKRLGFES